MPEALKKADEVLQQAVQGITDLINQPALINLDFADVQTVMTDAGIAHIGIGESRGDNKALEAVQQAVESPLLETTVSGATDIIINFSGDVGIMDTSEAVSYASEIAGEDVNIIFGTVDNDVMGEDVCITIIATGIEDSMALDASISIAPQVAQTSPQIQTKQTAQPKVAKLNTPSFTSQQSVNRPSFLNNPNNPHNPLNNPATAATVQPLNAQINAQPVKQQAQPQPAKAQTNASGGIKIPDFLKRG
jgi:cell division protein FtsZ